MPRYRPQRRQPEFLGAMREEYERLKWKGPYKKGDGTPPIDLVNAWTDALNQRFVSWCELEENLRPEAADRDDRVPTFYETMFSKEDVATGVKRIYRDEEAINEHRKSHENGGPAENKQTPELHSVLRIDRSSIIQHGKLPSALVVPWGKQAAPFSSGSEVQLFEPKHIPTLQQPGFAMWFNMDAPDSVLHGRFEAALREARKQWPFVAKVRGMGAANPRTVAKDFFRKWDAWQIIPLFDLDRYFFNHRAPAPTLSEISEWIYTPWAKGRKRNAPDVSARKISEARSMLREAMSFRDALNRMSSSRRPRRVDTALALAFEESLDGSGEIANPVVGSSSQSVRPSENVDIDHLVADALANAKQSELGQPQLEATKTSTRGKPVEYQAVDWPPDGGDPTKLPD